MNWEKNVTFIIRNIVNQQPQNCCMIKLVAVTVTFLIDFF